MNFRLFGRRRASTRNTPPVPPTELAGPASHDNGPASHDNGPAGDEAVPETPIATLPEVATANGASVELAAEVAVMAPTSVSVDEPTQPRGCPFSGQSTQTPASPATTSADLLAEAEDFLRMFHDETSASDLFPQRWDQVRAEIEETGTYEHTFAELEWGARVAWRQSVRCMGRVRWRNLIVRDARHVRSAQEAYDEMVDHVRFGTNKGRIRSTITVFPADTAAGPRVRIWNEQLVRYAGYQEADGTILGDPRYVAFTDVVKAMGWQPPEQPGRFDLLPWVVETAWDEPAVFPAPREEILEVAITHPRYPWMAEFGLRWHALPAVSCMRLRVGGVDYSGAPFNGWYVADEVATRDFGDKQRYDMLPAIAEKLGLDTSSNVTYWRQRAAVEINVAVHHSFQQAGVSILDAVTESDLFVEFARKEESVGRTCFANWSWVNGHLAPSLGEAFHRTYVATEPNPNYWLDEDARQRALGEATGPTLVARHGAAESHDAERMSDAERMRDTREDGTIALNTAIDPVPAGVVNGVMASAATAVADASELLRQQPAEVP